MEETGHADPIFDIYIETYDEIICPKGEQIQYWSVKIEYRIHSKIDEEKYDDGDGVVNSYNY